jgi:hypothetical protein
MCGLQNMKTKHLLLLVWLQVHGLERGVLQGTNTALACARKL